MSFPDLKTIPSRRAAGHGCARSALAMALSLALLSTPVLILPMQAHAQDADQSPQVSMESPLERGHELYQSGSYLAAVDFFQRATGLEEEEGILGASRALMMLGEYEQAVSLLENAIDDRAASA